MAGADGPVFTPDGPGEEPPANVVVVEGDLYRFASRKCLVRWTRRLRRTFVETTPKWDPTSSGRFDQ